MDIRVARLLLLSAGLLASLVAGAVCQTVPETQVYYRGGEKGPRLGILPLANHSGRMEAVEVLVPGIQERVFEAGVEFLTAEELRPLLREYRIRGIGQIGAGGAAPTGV